MSRTQKTLRQNWHYTAYGRQGHGNQKGPLDSRRYQPPAKGVSGFVRRTSVLSLDCTARNTQELIYGTGYSMVQSEQLMFQPLGGEKPKVCAPHPRAKTSRHDSPTPVSSSASSEASLQSDELYARILDPLVTTSKEPFELVVPNVHYEYHPTSSVPLQDILDVDTKQDHLASAHHWAMVVPHCQHRHDGAISRHCRQMDPDTIHWYYGLAPASQTMPQDNTCSVCLINNSQQIKPSSLPQNHQQHLHYPSDRTDTQHRMYDAQTTTHGGRRTSNTSEYTVSTLASRRFSNVSSSTIASSVMTEDDHGERSLVLDQQHAFFCMQAPPLANPAGVLPVAQTITPDKTVPSKHGMASKEAPTTKSAAPAPIAEFNPHANRQENRSSSPNVSPTVSSATASEPLPTWTRDNIHSAAYPSEVDDRELEKKSAAPLCNTTAQPDTTLVDSVIPKETHIQSKSEVSIDSEGTRMETTTADNATCASDVTGCKHALETPPRQPEHVPATSTPVEKDERAPASTHDVSTMHTPRPPFVNTSHLQGPSELCDTSETRCHASQPPGHSDAVAPKAEASDVHNGQATKTHAINVSDTIQDDVLPVWADPTRVRENPTRYSKVRQYMKQHALPASSSLPLPHNVTFYFSETQHTSKQRIASSSYMSTVRPIFECTTVWEYASRWRRLKERYLPSQCQPNQNLYCFVTGVAPMWEDPANKAGGRLTVLPSRQTLDDLVEWVLAAFVGGNLEACGMVGLVFSRRTRGDRVEVWMHSTTTTQDIQQLKELLLHTLPTEMHDIVNCARFKKHF